MKNKQATPDDVLLTAGKLMHNASMNEQFMCMAFQIISGTSPKIASAIFFTFDSFPQRENLLRRVMALTHDAEDKELVMAVIRAAEKSGKQRKDLAHATIMFEGEFNNSSMRLYHAKSNTATNVTHARLDELSRHSWEAVQEAGAAIQKLHVKHGKSLTIALQ
ncbi:hypothetical protein [Nitrospira sp. Nam80]